MRRVRSVELVSVAALLAVGMGMICCGRPSPREVFEKQVVSTLETRCLSWQCHGVSPDSSARGEVVNWAFFNIRIRADGRVADLDEAYETTRRFINTVERPEFSTLLRKPLLVEAGGTPHIGGVMFRSRDEAAYRTLRDWIAVESNGGEGKPLSALTPRQQYFATMVMPKLATAQCLNQNCHGPFSPFTGFETPVLLDDQLLFPTAAIVKNYEAARMHLFLGGDPLLSRLVRKGLPLEGGGISHRGGNDIFFNRGGGDPRADPAVAAIMTWANAERIAAIGPMPAVTGIVFVKGPVAAEPPFTHDAFVPGKDLWVLSPPVPGGALRNLTGSAHSVPADVRDPAVSHDGKRIAFAMRKSLADAFNIYEMGVDGSGFHALTTDSAVLEGGGVAANVQPTYGPDGRVYFVSTRAGHVADQEGTLDTEIWRVEPRTLALERWTYDPAPEVTPTFIGTGKSYGTLAFTMLRRMGNRYKATVLRMPVDHDPTHHADPSLHPHHGATIPEDILYGMRTLPDGRFVATTFNRSNVWRGGRLVVFERQFGPEMPAGAETSTSLPNYRHAFTVLDDTVSATGPSVGGVYRDPAPLPDGRILVARATDPLDLSDVSATPDLGLWIATLTEDRVTLRTHATFEKLIDEPGVSEYDAEPIVARPLEDDPTHPAGWDPTAALGHAELRHVLTLETILSHLPPTGPKALRTDVAYARLIVPILMTPHDVAASPLGLAGHLRSVIVGEAPPAGESFNLDVPKNTPFRIQFLDGNRMAVGAQLNLWPAIAAGEHFGLSVASNLYPIMCGNCHGSLSGNPADIGGPPPDTITAASVTLATHQNGNPRLPLAPVPVPVGGKLIAVDFKKDVLPILSRSCTKGGCHAAPSPAGGLDLVARPTTSFDSAYEALLAKGPGSGGGRAYVDGDGASAIESYLVEIIFGRELSAPRTLGGCPGGLPPLTDDEKLTIVRWIDLGALYRGAP